MIRDNELVLKAMQLLLEYADSHQCVASLEAMPARGTWRARINDQPYYHDNVIDENPYIAAWRAVSTAANKRVTHSLPSK
jgi:hypothetical protein